MLAGVIPGSDMTPEAALSKISYILSKPNWDLQKRRKVLPNANHVAHKLRYLAGSIAN